MTAKSLKEGWARMKVYCVMDGSTYPQTLHSIFAQKKDAEDFAGTLNIYTVEEYEVIP